MEEKKRIRPRGGSLSAATSWSKNTVRACDVLDVSAAPARRAAQVFVHGVFWHNFCNANTSWMEEGRSPPGGGFPPSLLTEHKPLWKHVYGQEKWDVAEQPAQCTMQSCWEGTPTHTHLWTDFASWCSQTTLMQEHQHHTGRQIF